MWLNSTWVAKNLNTYVCTYGIALLQGNMYTRVTRQQLTCTSQALARVFTSSCKGTRNGEAASIKL